MEKITFAKALVCLFEAKQKTYSSQTIDVWFSLLSVYPEGKVLSAILALSKTPDHFINVGMIIERIFPNITAEAEGAWNEAYRSSERSGRLPIRNATARALNAIGGMMKLRDCPLDDIHWLRKEFIDAYVNLQHSDIKTAECFGLTAGIENDVKELEIAPELKPLLEGIGKKI